MNPTPQNSLPPHEVAVRVVPAPPEEVKLTSTSSGGKQSISSRRYIAQVFASPELHSLFGNLPWQRENDSQPTELGGLVLCGAEEFTLPFELYAHYLEQFTMGEKAAYLLRQRLREVLPQTIQSVWKTVASDQVGRLWWSNTAPELEDWPWELLINSDSASTFSFVRGIPAREPTPSLPAGTSLRVALIGASVEQASALRQTLRALSGKGVHFQVFPQPPRQALRLAAQEEYEVVHWVSDATLSLAHEAILFSPNQEGMNDSLTAMEISQIFRYSRVGVLVLSTSLSEEYRKPREVATAYRAFAQLGGDRQWLPNVVAPLGPFVEGGEEDLWRNFYRQLSRTLEIESAVSAVRNSNSAIVRRLPPIALFLRHRQRQTFRRSPSMAGGRGLTLSVNPDSVPTSSHEVEAFAETYRSPTSLSASLSESQGIIEQISSLASSGSIPSEVLDFLEEEKARHGQLERDWESWKEAS